MVCYGWQVNIWNDPMRIPSSGILSVLLVCMVLGGSLNTQAQAQDQDAKSVRFGEAALRFSAGYIRETTPLDGVVNSLTGDNQTIGNRMLVGESNTVYLRLTSPGEGVVGDLYTVYRRVRKVFHPANGRYLGFLTNILGVVRVVQVDHELITAHVICAYAPISPGDGIMRFVPPVQEEADQGAGGFGEIEGMIVEVQTNQFLIGQRNLVYLDKGRLDGLRVGDRLEVFRTGSGLPRRTLGEIKVLALEDGTAAGLLTRATAPILRGDRFRWKGSDVGGPAEGLLLPEQPRSDTIVEAAKRPDESVPAAGREKIQFQQAGRRMLINLDELVDQLEYESGEVAVKPGGMKILEQIADYLKTVTDKHIRVEGHADNVEIGPSLKAKYPTNWELSKARASFVVRYLIEKGGIDSAQLSAVGYGDTRPVASNATEEGRRKNRRIEIVLYSPESPRKEPLRAPVQSRTGEEGYSFSRLGSAPSGSDPLAAPPSSRPLDDLAAPQPGQAASAGETGSSDVTIPSTSDAPVPQADQPSDLALPQP